MIAYSPLVLINCAYMKNESKNKT